MSGQSIDQASVISSGVDDDELPSGPGGKKRKGLGHLQVKRPAGDDDQDPWSAKVSPKISDQQSFPITKRLPRSSARLLATFRKSLFLRRKAAFINLYIDAQAVIKSTVHLNNKSKSTFPDVSDFEKLLPALENVDFNAWAPDGTGWRENATQPTKWRKRRRTRGVQRAPVERKGWMPEGSFEFEMECKASKTMRTRAREQSALLRLAHELRSLILTSNTITNVVKSSTPAPPPKSTEDNSPSKSRRKLEKDKKVDSASTGTVPIVDLAADATPQSQPMSHTPSKDSSETGKGKKKKKKRRSVLANQSNPHHVDNYRPSRTVSPHSDPYEPYSYHMSLFSPPSMPFLATRPRSKLIPNGPSVVRPGEEDYICFFCEYDLYYGSEKSRRNAIRRRKEEIRRKETIKTKARNVAEGRGKLNDENDYETEDDEDDDAGCDDDGHGRCTCGRRVRKPKPDKVEAHIEIADTGPP